MGTLMARWKSHEALRLGRYGFSCRSVAASRASPPGARGTPAVTANGSTSADVRIATRRQYNAIPCNPPIFHLRFFYRWPGPPAGPVGGAGVGDAVGEATEVADHRPKPPERQRRRARAPRPTEPTATGGGHPLRFEAGIGFEAGTRKCVCGALVEQVLLCTPSFSSADQDNSPLGWKPPGLDAGCVADLQDSVPDGGRRRPRPPSGRMAVGHPCMVVGEGAGVRRDGGNGKREGAGAARGLAR